MVHQLSIDMGTKVEENSGQVYFHNNCICIPDFFSMTTQITHGSQGIYIDCCKEIIKTLDDLHPNACHYLMTP